jgi:hypothetical protein
VKKKKQKDFLQWLTGSRSQPGWHVGWEREPPRIKVFFASFFFRKKKTLPYPLLRP